MISFIPHDSAPDSTLLSTFHRWENQEIETQRHFNFYYLLFLNNEVKPRDTVQLSYISSIYNTFLKILKQGLAKFLKLAYNL